MKRRVALLSVCLVVLSVVAVAQESLEDVLTLFDPDGDVHVAFSDEGKAQLERIIDVLRQTLGVPDYLDEESETEVGAFPVGLEKKDIVNKLSQAYYSYADAFLRDHPAQRATFLKGKQWGFKSLRMNPAFVAFEEAEGFVAAVQAEADVAALFWANANWLRWAEPDILSAIKAGIAKKSLAMSERALELDASYSTYASYRALGAFWQGLPSDPITPVLFTGGLRQDYEKVLASFCPIVEEPAYCGGIAGLIDPICTDYFENRVSFAQYYLMPLEHWVDAQRILQSVLDEPIGDLFPLYNGLNQLIAAELLDEVRKHL
jgi:hypothetical protein